MFSAVVWNNHIYVFGGKSNSYHNSIIKIGINIINNNEPFIDIKTIQYGGLSDSQLNAIKLEVSGIYINQMEGYKDTLNYMYRNHPNEPFELLKNPPTKRFGHTCNGI